MMRRFMVVIKSGTKKPSVSVLEGETLTAALKSAEENGMPFQPEEIALCFDLKPDSPSVNTLQEQIRALVADAVGVAGFAD